MPEVLGSVSFTVVRVDQWFFDVYEVKKLVRASLQHKARSASQETNSAVHFVMRCDTA